MDKDSDLVAAICDHLLERSGFFGVYHLTGDRVDWQARVEQEPWEQSIRSLRVLRLETRAVDFNADPVQFRNGQIEPEYLDLNGDGFSDVRLTGILEEWDEKGDMLLNSRPYRRVFLWNSDHGKFVEDASRRVGLESSD